MFIVRAPNLFRDSRWMIELFYIQYIYVMPPKNHTSLVGAKLHIYVG